MTTTIQAGPTGVPSDVLAALDRMCTPLHESHLKGATAEADAHCMKIIRDYVLAASEARDVGELTDERTAFESAYAPRWFQNCGCNNPDAHLAGTLRAMRAGDSYGERYYLNGAWWGWQARALLATRASEATPTDPLSPEGQRTLYERSPGEAAPHVGESRFEGWYADYLLSAPVHQEPKQRARDAYAAGMGEAAPVAVGDAKEIVWPVPLSMDEGGVEHSVELRFESEEDADEFSRIYSNAMGTRALASQAVPVTQDAQQASEPVAYLVTGRDGYNKTYRSTWIKRSNAEASADCLYQTKVTPLYAAPQPAPTPDVTPAPVDLNDLRRKIAAAPRRQFESAPGVYTSWLDQCAVLDILDAAKVVATLSDTELTLFNETADQFGDCNETSTGHATLMRWANMGLLECEHFTVTPAGEALLAGRGASKAEAQSS